MTSPNTTTGWNGKAGSNSTDYSQKHNRTKSGSEEIMVGDYSVKSIQIQRSEYYRNHYDFMTGVRIAATLGGFFLFVLLTLLYKSKCKKSSREPTPVPLYQGQSTHPDLVVLSSNPSPQPTDETSQMINHHHTRHFIMDQQPGPSHNHYQSPKVFLTAAHDSSESSIESELFMSDLQRQGSNSSLSSKYHKIPPIAIAYTKKKNVQPAQQVSLLQQNIDIHVIQPTPTISPSSSANIFNKLSRNKSKKVRDHKTLTTTTRKPSRDSDSSVTGTNPLFFLQAENLSLKYMDDTSSENIPTRGSDFDEDDSGGSLGSDSVFSFERKLSNVTDEADQDEGDGEICRVTLTEAHAQVHHRDSYCSSEYESLTDYMECHRRRSSSTQTTWSDLRQCLALGQSPGNHSPLLASGRRDSMRNEEVVGIPIITTTTNSLLLTPININPASSSSSSPLLNCSSRKQSIISIQDQSLPTNSNTITKGSNILNKGTINSIPTSATTTSSSIPIPTTTQNQYGSLHNTNLNIQGNRKQSLQTLKKTYSLQCDDEQKLLPES